MQYYIQKRGGLVFGKYPDGNFRGTRYGQEQFEAGKPVSSGFDTIDDAVTFFERHQQDLDLDADKFEIVTYDPAARAFTVVGPIARERP